MFGLESGDKRWSSSEQTVTMSLMQSASEPPRPKLDQAYWEDCYQRGEMRWEKGAPSPGLVDFLTEHPELPRGTVCVPGCGTGHDVRAWARSGFDAWGVDIAPSAVRTATAWTPQSGLKAQFCLADFLSAPPPVAFDWVFEHTLFCAIHPQDRRAYREALLRWLKPDGHFLAVHYLIPDEDGPPFGTTREEVHRWFDPQFHLIDAWEPRSYPNRIGLELMMWWRRRG